MLNVPLQDAPAQSFRTLLGGQACQINLRQRSTGLFCDVSVDDVPVVTGAICRHLGLIVRSAYSGFVGDLVFFDTQSNSDPTTPGLGTRYLLQYLETTDL